MARADTDFCYIGRRCFDCTQSCIWSGNIFCLSTRHWSAFISMDKYGKENIIWLMESYEHLATEHSSINSSWGALTADDFCRSKRHTQLAHQSPFHPKSLQRKRVRSHPSSRWTRRHHISLSGNFSLKNSQILVYVACARLEKAVQLVDVFRLLSPAYGSNISDIWCKRRDMSICLVHTSWCE